MKLNETLIRKPKKKRWKMKKSNVLYEVATLLVITILLAYDFFPALNTIFYIPKPWMLLALATILIISSFVNRRYEQSAKQLLIRHIVVLVYSLLLLSIFTLMGGSSQVGISLAHPALWIVVAFSLIQINRQRKKMNDQGKQE
jgi:FtsH-binding integral membrane protein